MVTGHMEGSKTTGVLSVDICTTVYECSARRLLCECVFGGGGEEEEGKGMSCSFSLIKAWT